MSNQTSVSDIFRRALAIKEANPNATFEQVRQQIVSEFGGKPFPPVYNLTIPEFDNITPEEDWTAGLSVILRGIQLEDWNEIAHGIIISLDEIKNYPRESLREDAPEKEWRNRHEGIAEAEAKNLEKWMPDELKNLVQMNSKREKYKV